MGKGIDLIWLAGFFDGEGSISIQRSKDEKRSTKSWQYCSSVRITQLNETVIGEVQRITAEAHIPSPVIVRPSKLTSPTTQLCWCTAAGTYFLRAISSYLHYPNRVARAEIYCKLFDPNKKYTKRAIERTELYILWLRQKLSEEAERQLLRSSLE